MKKINMAIVGSHARFRTLLVMFLKESPQKYEVLFEAENDVVLFEQLETKKPDVLLFDLEIPASCGIETIRMLKKKHPELKVIVSSVAIDETTVTAVIKYGACGFLTKDATDPEMHEAIESALNNEFCYCGKIANKLLQFHFGNICTDLFKDKFMFDSVDLDIIIYRASDWSWEEIADKMYLSRSTLTGRMEKITSKLIEKGFDIKGVGSLAVFAYRHNLIR